MLIISATIYEEYFICLFHQLQNVKSLTGIFMDPERTNLHIQKKLYKTYFATRKNSTAQIFSARKFPTQIFNLITIRKTYTMWLQQYKYGYHMHLHRCSV